MRKDQIQFNYFNNKKTYITKSDNEIKEIALGIVSEKIYSSLQIKDLQFRLDFIFFPLGFLSPIEKKQLLIDEISNCYGYIMKNSINERYTKYQTIPMLMNNVFYLDINDSKRLAHELLKLDNNIKLYNV